jgi:uncharacterized protein
MSALPLPTQESPRAITGEAATRPLEPTDRSRHIDIIRGVAVFGLIWSNLNAGFYTGPVTAADSAARWATTVFSAGKFFTLFSLLFGVTLAMQLARAESESRPLAARWARRMIVLFAIGWAHALLFWPGDILREYAIAGAVLVLFRRASNRTVLLVAAAAFAVAGSRDSLSVAVTRLAGGDVQAVRQRERPDSAQLVRRRAAGEALRTGTYSDVIGTRIQVFPREQLRRASPPAGPLNWINPWYLGLFLLGLVLGRWGIVQQPEHHRRAVLALAAIGVTVGLPLNVYLAATPAWLANSPAQWPLSIIAKLALSLGYLGGLLWLLQRRRWLARLRWLAPVGRLALTNYVAQTAFLMFVKSAYGLGLEPTLGWFACFVLAFSFYLVQVWWSNWWVGQFRFGPLEWLWRRLSYGTTVAMHARPVAAT